MFLSGLFIVLVCVFWAATMSFDVKLKSCVRRTLVWICWVALMQVAWDSFVLADFLAGSFTFLDTNSLPIAPFGERSNGPLAFGQHFNDPPTSPRMPTPFVFGEHFSSPLDLGAHPNGPQAGSIVSNSMTFGTHFNCPQTTQWFQHR